MDHILKRQFIDTEEIVIKLNIAEISKLSKYYRPLLGLEEKGTLLINKKIMAELKNIYKYFHKDQESLSQKISVLYYSPKNDSSVKSKANCFHQLTYLCTREQMIYKKVLQKPTNTNS